MPGKKFNRSVRFNHSQMEKISTFMESTRDPEVDKVAGKNTLAGSITKAVWFLFNSSFDDREFLNRGMFDRSLFDLSDNIALLNKAGHQLNELVHAYNSGQPPRLKRLDILDELDSLLSENVSLIDEFQTSYKVGEEN